MIIEIKQTGKFDDRDNKSEYGGYTMFPMSARSYVVGKRVNGSYRTGLEEDVEKRTRLEKAVGESLDERASFWKNYRLTFTMPTGSMRLNTEDPLQEIFVEVAKANFMVAPDEATLKTDHRYKRNTIFYIYDKEEEVKRVSALQEIKDEVSGYVFSFRNNKDKLLFIAHALGIYVTDSFKAENLYSLLTKYKEQLKTFEQFENLKTVLKLSNEELQAIYYTKQGLKQSIIVFDSAIKKYRFQEKHIASLESELQSYFKNSKNEADLAALIMEVKAKQN